MTKLVIILNLGLFFMFNPYLSNVETLKVFGTSFVNQKISSTSFLRLGLPRLVCFSCRHHFLVRTLIDMCDALPNAHAFQIELCLDCIKWCEEEKRSFLRMRMETKLASLYLHEKKFHAALELLGKLTKEVKRIDDKLLLVEIHLIEARVQFAIENLPKAKAALTASRTNANSINCPPLLQASIDTLNGELNAAEGDFKTAYSYFYEAFEAYNLHDTGSDKALRGFMLLLLAKTLCDQPSEVNSLASGKHGIKYASRGVEALRAIAKAHSTRSVKAFEEALVNFDKELRGDECIRRHISDMQEKLLEFNLIKVLEPYSKVEIAYVAELLEFAVDRVLVKLAEMLLDGKIKGTLDQGQGILVLFKDAPLSSMYADTLSTLKKLSVAADTLNIKAAQLSV